MKKGRLTILGALFLAVGLFGETSAAMTADASAEEKSESPNQQTSKEIRERARGITSDPSTFTPETPFGEAIDILRNSTDPPLNIVVLWRDLEENADIDRDTPIGMDGVSGIRLRTCLKLLLASVSGGGLEKLRYVVEGGVITIATQDSLPKRKITRVYDITDLVSAPANYRFMPGLGMGFGFGGMGYGGQGMYGAPGGRSYGGYGMPYMGGGYGPSVGGISTATGRNINPYIARSPRGYNRRGGDLAGLIDSLYGSNRRRSYSNSRGARRSR